MTSEHIILIVGLIALAVIAFTSFGFRVIKKKLSGKKKVKFEAVLEGLDEVRLLPVLWILSGISIGYWLVARVVISYS